ncbi:Trypsin-like peptidase domain-containing protein [Mucilaginibacter pineti]|uniref:Trypsin-like peptidase domain-containing protein n=1 Tax=Mucilaginibacter pineti TaxID=1391627 RepID=A0A1G7IT72_9SPHI|nr:DUF4231 domain-containing protein [Mucilaginibacter pineti]SDF15509.1 Trypsin-like peptidase domain-containing protein [Mucilaginibacter pineti]
MAKKSKLSQLIRERMEQYSEIIERLQLDSAKKKQLQVDFLNYIKIIEKLADKNLFLNDLTNIVVIILTAVVPIMINITPKLESGTTYDIGFLHWATALSVILAILNGFRQSYKFRERWQNYRQTIEQLILEGQSYFALSGKYSTFDTHELAFRKFIEMVNSLRTQELNAYISLTTVSDKDVAQSINAEVSSRLTAINSKKDIINQRIMVNDELNSFVKAAPKISYYLADHDQKQVTIYTNDQTYQGPEKFSFTNPALKGLVYKSITKFGDAQINSLLGPSNGIKNQDMPTRGFGSAGCLCKRSDGTEVIVTCYHVVKHSSQDWDLFVPGDHDGVINSSSEFIGNITEGEKSSELDSALVEIDAGVDTDELLPGGLKVIDPIYIDEGNYQDFADVYLISRQRNFKKIQGRLSAVNKPVTINYGTAAARDMKNLDKLMIVTFVSTEPFSMPGDSGSLVFSSDGTAIGILVGSDGTQSSFVIPFTTIRDRYNLKL